MIGDGDQVASPGSRVDGSHPAEVALDELDLLSPGYVSAVGAAQGECFLSVLVGHGDDSLPIAQPRCQALTGRRDRSVSGRRTLPQGHGVGAAADGDRQGVALGMKIDRLDESSR